MAFLNLAPSQLHPNAFAFMRAFEIVCNYLGIGATTALFGRCFRIQRQAANGRYSWVSFRNAERKLFGMYIDSVKGFKDRYFVVQPISRTAYTEVSDLVVMRDEDSEVLRDEDGHVMRELCTRFPFFWWKGHFSSPPKHYVWEDDDLDDQDRESYSVLCKYVDSFTMSRWVTRNGDLVLDEEGVPVTEQRPINTKALLACRTPEETWTLLGCAPLPCFVISVRYFANLFYFFFAEAMPEKEDNILKQALDARKNMKKRNQGTGAGENSGSAGSPHKTHADEKSSKRSRPSEGGRLDQSNLGPVRAFVLPPCYKDGSYFEKFPLAVSPDEARRISDMDSSSLQKQLASDGAAVMRVLGMAQVLASGGSGSTEALKEAEAAKKVAEDKVKTMETERRDLRKKVDALLKQKDADLATEKKKLADLQLEWAPSADESSDVVTLKSRAEFVEKIDSLKISLADMADVGFERALQQLRLLNPDLKEDNVGLSSRFVDGVLEPEAPENEE